MNLIWCGQIPSIVFFLVYDYWGDKRFVLFVNLPCLIIKKIIQLIIDLFYRFIDKNRLFYVLALVLNNFLLCLKLWCHGFPPRMTRVCLAFVWLTPLRNSGQVRVDRLHTLLRRLWWILRHVSFLKMCPLLLWKWNSFFLQIYTSQFRKSEISTRDSNPRPLGKRSKPINYHCFYFCHLFQNSTENFPFSHFERTLPEHYTSTLHCPHCP